MKRIEISNVEDALLAETINRYAGIIIRPYAPAEEIVGGALLPPAHLDPQRRHAYAVNCNNGSTFLFTPYIEGKSDSASHSRIKSINSPTGIQAKSSLLKPSASRLS